MAPPRHLALTPANLAIGAAAGPKLPGTAAPAAATGRPAPRLGKQQRGPLRGHARTRTFLLAQ
eukprot:11183762-Lingulodinium_polyedra.AAC.1